jgi:hypothetical protein
MAAVDRDLVTAAPAAGEKLMVADCKAMAFESTVDVPTKLGLRMCSFRERRKNEIAWYVVYATCQCSCIVILIDSGWENVHIILGRLEHPCSTDT